MADASTNVTHHSGEAGAPIVIEHVITKCATDSETM